MKNLSLTQYPQNDSETELQTEKDVFMGTSPLGALETAV